MCFLGLFEFFWEGRGTTKFPPAERVRERPNPVWETTCSPTGEKETLNYMLREKIVGVERGCDSSSHDRNSSIVRVWTCMCDTGALRSSQKKASRVPVWSADVTFPGLFRKTALRFVTVSQGRMNPALYV